MTVVRVRFEITSWVLWDDEIHLHVEAFRTHHGLAPHILVASSATFRRIDIVAKKERLVDGQGGRAPPNEYAVVSSFSGADYLLEFCVDERIPAGSVVLVYDSDPGGGEPLPWEDTPTIAGPAALRRA